MKAFSPLSSVFLGAALAFTPALVMAQRSPSPETAIPRHTSKGDNGKFAPPANRQAPPEPAHTVQAHKNNSKQAKKGKQGSNSNSESDSSATNPR